MIICGKKITFFSFKLCVFSHKIFLNKAGNCFIYIKNHIINAWKRKKIPLLPLCLCFVQMHFVSKAKHFFTANKRKHFDPSIFLVFIFLLKFHIPILEFNDADIIPRILISLPRILELISII